MAGRVEGDVLVVAESDRVAVRDGVVDAQQARVEIDAPISYYGEADGLASNVLALERLAETVAAMDGGRSATSVSLA